MLLTFIGADHEVTGSCHYLKVNGKNILIDYGMEQGRDYYVNQPLPIQASNIDYVFATHAHIDHTGMLPRLYHEGYRGPIISTKATAELSDIMLRDSAHIQVQEAAIQNKKAGRRGEAASFEPVYTMEDAMATVRLFARYDYDRIYDLCEGVRFRFTDVGHLLGSASIEFWLTEDGVERKVCFSGDIGNVNQPLLRDPQPTESADYVIMESTYGDRLHEPPKGDWITDLAEVIQDTLDRGGNVVIPAFAVGRTQVMLYFIKQIKERGLVQGHDGFKVYVDSPMAVEATSVFEDNELACFDEEAMALVRAGKNPIAFPGLNLSITTEESRDINDMVEPKVIISASGMCDAGRIRHHLKYNISRADSTILFVGYQAEGSLGRRITEGADHIRIFGEDLPVRARVAQIDGLSGHADRDELIRWLDGFKEKPRKVFVVHGEDTVTDAFVTTLEEEHGYDAFAPFSGTQFDLAKGAFTKVTKGVPIARKSSGNVGQASSSFTKLKIAHNRLTDVVNASQGLTNKDLEAFTKELNDLCRKYQISK